MRSVALPRVGDPCLFFLVDEVPTGEVEGLVDREPGFMVALPEDDPDIEFPELGPPLIIGQNVQAFPFSQESRVESPHSLRYLHGVPLLVGGRFLRQSQI